MTLHGNFAATAKLHRFPFSRTGLSLGKNRKKTWNAAQFMAGKKYLAESGGETSQ